MDSSEIELLCKRACLPGWMLSVRCGGYGDGGAEWSVDLVSKYSASTHLFQKGSALFLGKMITKAQEFARRASLREKNPVD